MIGKIIHYSADLVLASAFLAGIKRGTGLSPNLDIIENKDIKYYGNKYFEVGDIFYDATATFLSNTDYFKRK